MRYSKEEDLAIDVIAFLQRSGWNDIYSEVFFNGAPIDIVAVRTRPGIKEVLVCECKLAFNIHLLQQARRNSYAATYTMIATPHIRMNWDDAQLVKDILEWLNIGMLRVDGKFVLEDKSLPKGDANIQAILDVLRPEHKSFAKAGSNRGFWTPFKTLATDDQDTALHSSSKIMGQNIEAAINEIHKRVDEKRRAEKN